MTRNRIAATVVATLALGAAAPAASAEEQRAMSPEQQYAYTCGHLGTDCAGEEQKSTSNRKRSRKACGARQRRAAKRAGRKAARRYTRRCYGSDARRSRARR